MAETENPDGENNGKLGLYHVSVGSASTNIHFSADYDANDPELEQKLSKLLELWFKTLLARKQYDARLK